MSTKAKKVKVKKSKRGSNRMPSETALVPRVFEAKIRKQQENFIQVAESMVVTCVGHEEDAREFMTEVNKLSKEIESKRKEITQPINQSLKAANALFKPLKGVCDDVVRTVKGKILEFRREEDRKARVEEERRRKIQEAHVAKGHTVRKEVKSVQRQVSQQTRTMTQWKWDVEDLEKVPGKYWVLDMRKIGQEVRAGMRECPGLKIWSEQTVRL